MDGAGAQLFASEAERRRVIVRPRRPIDAADLLLFMGVRIIRFLRMN